MKCPGCYKEQDVEGYCLQCRKKLFDGKKVSHILNFETPKDENLRTYQESTKGISISGVQLKYSLKIEGNNLVLTDKDGEYLLKPIPPAEKIIKNNQAPENEHLTMQIARQVFGIDTAENALIFFKDGTPAYITKRFDRKPDGSKYLQEDFAQLLGKTKQAQGENFKYEGTYEMVGEAIRRFVPASIPVLERFFEQILFNYIFSNGDAHLKNFSLIESPELGSHTLSRAYDLMDTDLHIPDHSEVALELYENDSENEFYAIEGYYGQYHFRELAGRLDIQEKRANRIIGNMLMKREEVLNMIENSFLSQEAKAEYKKHYENRLKRMGINELVIREKISVNASISDKKEPGVKRTVKVLLPGTKVKFFPRRSAYSPIEGRLTKLLPDNRYELINDNNEVIVVEADMMIDVQLVDIPIH